MRVLLDTHVLLWWLAGERLSDEAIEVIGDPTNEVYVSAATVWELSIKRQLGKVDMPEGLVAQCVGDGMRILVIDARHAELAGSLPPHHTDPFDRMLIAQAQLDTLIIVTRDRAFADYGIPVLAA